MTPDVLLLHASHAASVIFMVVAAVFFVASVGWSLQQSVRHRNVLAWMALIGGAIASLEESWVDHLIQLWYPLDAPGIMFQALGTPQPLYLHFIYPGFIGLGAYATYLGLLRNPDGRALWPTFVAIMAMDLAFEGGATYFHVFYYYGPQPFQLVPGGWPAWVAPINAAGPIVGGWLIYKLEPYLRGWFRPIVALLPPIAYSGVYGATGWPTSTLMNSQVPQWAIWAGAAISMLLSWLIVLIMRVTLVQTRNAPATNAAYTPSRV